MEVISAFYFIAFNFNGVWVSYIESIIILDGCKRRVAIERQSSSFFIRDIMQDVIGQNVCVWFILTPVDFYPD